jgi:hypothetical protein
MFTEMERALMAGGHSLDYESKPAGMMSFIKELKEARMLRSESDLKLTYSGACELLYLTVLTIEFLSRLKKGKAVAEKYAKTTCAYSNYTEFRSGATDLHNLIYFVQAEPRRVEQIFHSSDARKARERIHLPTMALNGWLHSINSDSSRNVYFLMQLEQALGINTALYKEIRRLLSYNNPVDTDISNMAARILNAYRTYMPQFDLLQDIDQILSNPSKL